METVVGKTFRNQIVHLDYSFYEKCSFIDGTIHIEAGIFGLVNCDLSNCKLSLGGPAGNVARLIKDFFKDRPIFFEGERKGSQ